MDLSSILVFAGTTLASPLLVWIMHQLIDKAKIRKAHKRLRDEDLIHEGARFSRLLGAAGTQLMGPGRIVSLEPGRVLVVSDEGAWMTFTGQEFEAMHPQFVAAPQQDAGPEGSPNLPPGAGGREAWG
ncbi:MAG: hypothetical protein OXI22_00840 [Defluviicoccus sp.]|nr:hypothetical protein [Defluviicoccus sp.]